jgi:hypothetical protein
MVAVGTPVAHTFELGGGRAAVVCSGLSYSESEGDCAGGGLAAAGHATGATQWPAGRLLCEYLVADAAADEAAWRGARGVELGCGLGMVGLVFAALAGPSGAVVLSDGDAGCVAWAAANAAASAAHASRAPASVQPLLWGDASAAERLCAAAGGPFPLVLGGDLIYGEAAGGGLSAGTGADNVAALFFTAEALLSRAPRAQLLLGFQRRSVPLAAVLAAAARHGLAADVPPGGARPCRPPPRPPGSVCLTRPRRAAPQAGAWTYSTSAPKSSATPGRKRCFASAARCRQRLPPPPPSCSCLRRWRSADPISAR